jgi:hypothetical protein
MSINIQKSRGRNPAALLELIPRTIMGDEGMIVMHGLERCKDVIQWVGFANLGCFMVYDHDDILSWLHARSCCV